MSRYEDGLPVEEFIQALASQLDRAQATLAMKARAGMPLTFAVKDIAIDLRAQVVMSEGQVRITPAGPRDPQASIIHLSLTTITRPMIEENTLQMAPDDIPLHQVLGDEVSDEERRRLEWAGIRTVSQLRAMERQAGEQAIEQVVQIPAMRLRAALERASRPLVARVGRESEGQLLIQGHNLQRQGLPTVRIGGQPLRVVRASERELVVAPPDGPLNGTLSIETAPGMAVEMALALDAPPDAGGAL
jgi:hypothetical protein